jgi:hypothetical protein
MSTGKRHFGPRLDRTRIEVVSDFDNSEETEYWRNASVEQRLEHLAYLRYLAFGDAATARLQRTLEVVQREAR